MTEGDKVAVSLAWTNFNANVKKKIGVEIFLIQLFLVCQLPVYHYDHVSNAAISN